MSIDISEEAGVRYLHFGSSWIQGAMRIARPFALELDYTREMMLPLLLRDAGWPRRVLLVGLGAGSLTKFLHRHRPDAKLTVVELDPRVEAAARQFFRLPDDPARIRIHHADGADYVAATRARFDLILVDGFDAEARAGRLDTLPFYLDCRARLAPGGLFCVNLISRRNTFLPSVRRIEEAFSGRILAFPSRDAGNAIAIGTAGVATTATLAELRSAARHLKDDTGLSLLRTVSALDGLRFLVDGRVAL